MILEALHSFERIKDSDEFEFVIECHWVPLEDEVKVPSSVEEGMITSEVRSETESKGERIRRLSPKRLMEMFEWEDE